MTTLMPSFLDGSSSFMQVTRPTIKGWMSLNFGKIPSLTWELENMNIGITHVSGKICMNNDHTCLFHCIDTCRVPRTIMEQSA